MNKTFNELERLCALQRHLQRKAATEEGLQTIHLEIIQYLALCNRYSNTTQALADYLGVTKSSISQSLGVLENKKFVKRVQDNKDLRVFHLHLTAKGRLLTRRIEDSLSLDLPPLALVQTALAGLLRTLQTKNSMKSFGLCLSCRFHQPRDEHSFQCGLTGEVLNQEESQMLCREHESEDLLTAECPE